VANESQSISQENLPQLQDRSEKGSDSRYLQRHSTQAASGLKSPVVTPQVIKLSTR